MRCLSQIIAGFTAACSLAAPAGAVGFAFSTGGPDGRLATASGPAGANRIETETADDFTLSTATRINGGSFTGLLPSFLSLAGVNAVHLEFYRVFPGDSATPPSGRVLTRDNSPADVDFESRDSTAGDLSFAATLLAASFTAANSVIDSINTFPNQFTGGDGAVTGQEVRFDFTFDGGVRLDAGHYFFVPQVTLNDGTFLWLSASKPIVAPGTPFLPDLQSWIRNENLAPDWSRVGTDITHQGPFNAAFTLDGSAVPEPTTWTLMVTALGLVGTAMRRRSAATAAA